jgi:hypothetical protein
MDRALRALVEYQRQRLRRTYADFGSDPAYHKVAGFFYEQVYNPDASDLRAEALRKMYEKLHAHLGAELVRQLRQLIELDRMTKEMDRAMADRLGPSFTDEEYERAYAALDNYAERLRQIRLIVDALDYFHAMAYKPGVGIALALLKPYAAMKGYGEVVEFLQEGYRAFRSIRDISYFRAQILAREVARLNRIFTQYGRGVPKEQTRETRRIARELGIRNAATMEFGQLLRAIQEWA